MTRSEQRKKGNPFQLIIKVYKAIKKLVKNFIKVTLLIFFFGVMVNDPSPITVTIFTGVFWKSYGKKLYKLRRKPQDETG